MLGFFITGTDTEIGKTLITSFLTLGLRQEGINTCPIKPLATGALQIDGEAVSEDAQVYQRLCGLSEPLKTLNPFCLDYPASPHFSAQIQQIPIDMQKIHDSILSLSQRYQALLIEGIGGWMVPIHENYFVADWACDLKLPVLVVSANKLGTLNHTLLTLESIRAKNLEPAGVIFTHLTPGPHSPVQKNNTQTIERLGHVPILGSVPYLSNIREQKPEIIYERIKDSFLWNRIKNILFHPKKSNA